MTRVAGVCATMATAVAAAVAATFAPTVVAWAPVPSALSTRWDKDVSADAAWPEYPRPTLVRPDPLSVHMLNGVWRLNRTVSDLSDPPVDRGIPDGEDILVPFPIESGLGGVRNVTEHGYAFYYLLVDKRVLPPRGPSRTRVLLHFEASDWETHVWVQGYKQTPISPHGNHTNNCPGGQCHRGGYDAFSFDITDSVNGPCSGASGSSSSSNDGVGGGAGSGVDCPPGHLEIIVGVFDPTDCDGHTTGGCNQTPPSNRTVGATAATGVVPTQLINPSGKQSRQPYFDPVCCGTRYTSTSGIWGSVWLEGVPSAYVADVVTTPWANLTGVDVDVALVATEDSPLGDGGVAEVAVTVFAGANASAAGAQQWTANASTTLAGHASDNPAQLRLSVPLPAAAGSPLRLWSPESPFLYNVSVSLGQQLPGGGAFPIETVSSYCGLRSVSLGVREVARSGSSHKDGNDDTTPTALLNGGPVFFSGPLDQGFWPSGIYTAPTDEALRFDLEATKAMGFNTIRKHMKVEPRRWYYWADVLGLLVLQDMPALLRNNGAPEAPAAVVQWRTELDALVRGRRHHPSVVQWTLINEGWGEPPGNGTLPFLEAAVAAVRTLDTSRFVDGVSGWTPALSPAAGGAGGGVATGDFLDFHDYTLPLPLNESAPAGYEDEALHRPYVLGEEGGYLAAPPAAQQWAPGKCFGHGNFTGPPGLFEAQYTSLVQSLVAQKQRPGNSNPSSRNSGGGGGGGGHSASGGGEEEGAARRLTLTGAIFTQITDVEGECNGLLTYARDSKYNATWLASVNAQLLRKL